jgi:hypothetical protein
MASDILSQYEKKYAEARKANEQRYMQGLSVLEQAVERYKPGGQFGEGAIAQYEIGKSQALSQGMQHMVSSGLSNTTVAAGMPLAYEQEVGTPFRLQLEDLRMSKLTDAEMRKAEFIQNRQDTYPDLGMMAELQQKASMGGGGVTYQKSDFLENWGKPDPNVRARNAAQEAERKVAYDALTIRNQEADARRAALRKEAYSESNKKTETKPATYSDAEYKELLEYNMGFTTAPTTMTGPNQPATNTTTKPAPTTQKSTTTSKSSDPGYWDLGYMLGY